MTRFINVVLVACIVLAVYATGAWAVSHLTATPTTYVGGSREAAKVYGCTQEDSCHIDYRGDPAGEGVWVIRRARH